KSGSISRRCFSSAHHRSQAPRSEPRSRPDSFFNPSRHSSTVLLLAHSYCRPGGSVPFSRMMNSSAGKTRIAYLVGAGITWELEEEVAPAAPGSRFRTELSSAKPFETDWGQGLLGLGFRPSPPRLHTRERRSGLGCSQLWHGRVHGLLSSAV